MFLEMSYVIVNDMYFMVGGQTGMNPTEVC
jgi:hypothetical protein